MRFDVRQSRFLVIALLVVITLAVFWPLREHEFLSYDDGDYVVENQVVLRGLTWEGVSWSFASTHAANWHPLTWLSHMVDVECFGTDPGGHHAVNMALHVFNTVLLFLVLQSMTGALWRSAVVAALFAVHPLHVESVAWIAERKDVLSTAFWLLTMAAYLRYVTRPGAGRWALAAVFFALGLLAKPMLVTLPFVLLLVDFWPLGRMGTGVFPPGGRGVFPRAVPLRRLVREKVPFFLMAATSSLATFFVQESWGAVRSMETFPVTVRIANAMVSYVKYIYKVFWPSRLAVLYPHPGTALTAWQIAAALLLLIALSALILRLARGRAYLTTGWFWYLGTLVPVIGLVQVGEQAMADRYTYVPVIGLFIMLAWGLDELAGRLRVPRTALIAGTLLVVAALSLAARNQVRTWRDSTTLFSRALAVTGDNHLANYNLALSLISLGRLDGAISNLEESIRIRPSFIKAHNNLGVALAMQGKRNEAMAVLENALKVNPGHASTYYNMGLLLYDEGRIDEAIGYYRMALGIRPDFEQARTKLRRLEAYRRRRPPPAGPAQPGSRFR